MVQCFEKLDKFLADQNEFYEPYGLEFVSPLANGLLHFDVIVHPFGRRSTDGRRSDTGPGCSDSEAELLGSRASPPASPLPSSAW